MPANSRWDLIRRLMSSDLNPSRSFCSIRPHSAGSLQNRQNFDKEIFLKTFRYTEWTLKRVIEVMIPTAWIYEAILFPT